MACLGGCDFRRPGLLRPGPRGPLVLCGHGRDGGRGRRRGGRHDGGKCVAVAVTKVVACSRQKVSFVVSYLFLNTYLTHASSCVQPQ